MVKSKKYPLQRKSSTSTMTQQSFSSELKNFVAVYSKEERQKLQKYRALRDICFSEKIQKTDIQSILTIWKNVHEVATSNGVTISSVKKLLSPKDDEYRGTQKEQIAFCHAFKSWTLPDKLLAGLTNSVIFRLSPEQCTSLLDNCCIKVPGIVQRKLGSIDIKHHPFIGMPNAKRLKLFSMLHVYTAVSYLNSRTHVEDIERDIVVLTNAQNLRNYTSTPDIVARRQIGRIVLSSINDFLYRQYKTRLVDPEESDQIITGLFFKWKLVQNILTYVETTKLMHPQVNILMKELHKYCEELITKCGVFVSNV